jgi:hypothetical protein
MPMSRKSGRQSLFPSPLLRVVTNAVLIIGGAVFISQTFNSSGPSTALFDTRTLVAGSSLLSTTTTVKSGKYPTYDCAKLLKDLATDPTTQALDPNKGKLYARLVVEDPSFYVALHDRNFDRARWPIFDEGYYYEKGVTKAFQEVLRESPPGSRILDVGGQYIFELCDFLLVSFLDFSVTDSIFACPCPALHLPKETLATSHWFRRPWDPLLLIPLNRTLRYA